MLTVFFQTGIRALTQKEFVVNQIVGRNLRVVVHFNAETVFRFISAFSGVEEFYIHIEVGSALLFK